MVAIWTNNFRHFTKSRGVGKVAALVNCDFKCLEDNKVNESCLTNQRCERKTIIT